MVDQWLVRAKEKKHQQWHTAEGVGASSTTGKERMVKEVWKHCPTADTLSYALPLETGYWCD